MSPLKLFKICGNMGWRNKNTVKYILLFSLLINSDLNFKFATFVSTDFKTLQPYLWSCRSWGITLIDVTLCTYSYLQHFNEDFYWIVIWIPTSLPDKSIFNCLSLCFQICTYTHFVRFFGSPIFREIYMVYTALSP